MLALEGDKAEREYGWVSLPDTLSQNIDAAVQPKVLAPVVEETQVDECAFVGTWCDPAGNEAGQVEDMVPVRHSILLEGIRRLWDLKPPPKSCPHLGLGATPDTPAKEDLPRERHARAQCYRMHHSKWLEATGASEDQEETSRDVRHGRS